MKNIANAQRSAPPKVNSGGRPREFDADQALEAAMQVFWSLGYEGTSLAELTDAMGIKRPSLYAAFGNKEALFKKVLDRYQRVQSAMMKDSLEEPTARKVAEALLHRAKDFFATDAMARGCLLVAHTMPRGAHAEPLRAEIVLRRLIGEAALVARFKRAKAAGDLPDGIEPQGLARLLIAVFQGMSVQASAGAGSKGLESLVETTLRIWPGR